MHKKAFWRIGYELVNINEIFKGKSIKNLIKYINDNICAIFIGDGETYNLLYYLYKYNLINVLRECLIKYKIKYIGIGSGSLITCLSICTSNNMAILQPPSLKSLSILPFQINCNYIHMDVRTSKIKAFVKGTYLHLCILT